MRVTIATSPAAAAATAAAMLAAEIEAAVEMRGICSIALSGGQTPRQMLKILLAKRVSWSSLHVFQVDERAVPFDDERRNARQIRDLLVRPGGLPATRFHALSIDCATLARCATDYAEVIRQFTGTPPVLDVVQLGLGADGHTASLMPDDHLLDVTDAEVGASGLYQGVRRLSLTFPALNRARRILWLVTGKAKAAMLRRLVDGDVVIPAGRVARLQATVISDAAAAIMLSDDDSNIG